ncbi:MAG: peroxiredoxin family protein [Myxococcota bacterium]
MRLLPGQPAPDFTALTHDGRAVTLSSLRGQRVWLAFYRFASCPFCNLRMHQLMDGAPRWQAGGLRMLAVFHSSPAAVAEMVARRNVSFPILCDPDEDLYRRYGVETSVVGVLSPANIGKLREAQREGVLADLPKGADGRISRVPADFFIDERGIIQTAYYGKNISDHIPLDDVEGFSGAVRAA